MRVLFIKGYSDPQEIIFEAEMATLPRRNEMLVIDEVVYECSTVKHIFKSTGRRSGQHSYHAEVRVQPV